MTKEYGIVKLQDLEKALPVDPTTEEGRVEIKETVDAIIEGWIAIPKIYFCTTANQIGIPKRVIGFRVPGHEPFFIFNPTFSPFKTGGIKRIWEMSLCFEEGEKYRIRRYKKIKLFHDSIEGEREAEIIKTPKIAIAIQHSIDILNARKVWK